jgi:hypothetical protein
LKVVVVVALDAAEVVDDVDDRMSITNNSMVE